MSASRTSRAAAATPGPQRSTNPITPANPAGQIPNSAQAPSRRIPSLTGSDAEWLRNDPHQGQPTPVLDRVLQDVYHNRAQLDFKAVDTCIEDMVSTKLRLEQSTEIIDAKIETLRRLRARIARTNSPSVNYFEDYEPYQNGLPSLSTAAESVLQEAQSMG